MDSVSFDGARDLQRLEQNRPSHRLGHRRRAHHPVQPLDTRQVKTPDRAGAQQILKHEVMGALRNRFAMVPDRGVSYGTTPQPAETAGQIVQTVNDVQANAGAQAPEALDQAADAVDEGFQQTQAILSSLGAFNTDIAELVSNIQALVSQGLTQLQSNLGAAGVESLNAEYARTERTEIRIETQEGDVVRVRIGERSEANIEALSAADGGGTSVSLSSSSSLGIRIEGDLNESELAAITDLLSNAEAIVDDFFSGNALDAFSTVSQLGFDAEQLAGFSLRAAVREQFSMSGVFTPVDTPVEEPVEPPAEITPVTPPVVEDPGVPTPVTPPVAEDPVVPTPVTPPVAEDPIVVDPITVTPEEPVEPVIPDPVLPVSLDDADAAEAAPVAEVAEVTDAELEEPALETGVPAYDTFQVVVDFMASVFQNIRPDSQQLVMTQRLVVDVLDAMIDVKLDEAGSDAAAGADLFKQILDSAATTGEAAS